jgi:hypothetical protein
MAVVKTHSELSEYMWKLYPKDTLRDYRCREAMLRAYHFLTGRYDAQEKQREQVAEDIYQKLLKEKPFDKK